MSGEKIDNLTGIYNRYGFYERTEKMLKNHTDIQFNLIYLNIRRFKVVNNLFGWESGNKILINLAEALRKEFENETSTYARMERDNFVCCVSDEVLEKNHWLKLGNITYEIEGTEYQFSSCYGLYKIDDLDLPVANMSDRARVAMETVKDNYLKPYAWYEDSMWETIVEEQHMNSSFQKAIAENQFKVYYQPVCNTDDGSITGAEALVRWQKPDEGLISPGKFIPVFERNGLISVLDRYVWNEVCKMQRRRIDNGMDVVPVSINVSRVEFYNQHLCEDIYNIVKKYNLPTELIKIEITESAYADDPGQVLAAVRKLHEYGFIVLMDDFGSGYSSLNTLKDLPIDVLKIDMKFMDSLDENKKASVILEAVIRMAKWMKLSVVAEGVETKTEWEYLRSMECDVVQGYYFYRPMPEHEFESLLNHKNLFNKDKDFPELDDIITDAFNHGGSKESMIFYRMLGGMGVYELTDEGLEVLQVNRGYYEVVYGVKDTSVVETKRINKQVKEPERSILMEKCRQAVGTDTMHQVQIHFQRDNGDYVWLNVKIRYIGSSGKRALFYFAIDNIDEIKKAEQERYLLDYTSALIKVYDKIYKLDYSTGLAEVLHTSESSMKTSEKYYFFDFFDRFGEDFELEESEVVTDIIKNKKRLDVELEKSRRGSFSVHYKVNREDLDFKEVSAVFFKISQHLGEEEYICCIKKKYRK